MSCSVLPALTLVALGCGAPAIDAAQVKTITVSGERRLCVREPLTLKIEAVMLDGSKRTTDPKAARAQRFDPDELGFDVDFGSVEIVRTGKLNPDPDFVSLKVQGEPAVLEENVIVHAYMKKNRSAEGVFAIEPDFSCPVEIRGAGNPGDYGSQGQMGDAAGLGGAGAPGGNGYPAEDIELFLTPYRSAKRGELVKVRARSASGRSETFFIAKDGSISVDASGGPGGTGGSGGTGGRGLDATSGTCDNGGVGGPGGPGGPGGTGGTGGAITLHVDASLRALADRVRMSAEGGPPGMGGPGGPGGSGGSGGGATGCPQVPMSGESGSAGPAGREGSPGQAGPPPRVSVEELGAEGTPETKKPEDAEAPAAPELPPYDAKAASAFEKAHAGTHTFSITNATDVAFCALVPRQAGRPNLLATPLAPKKSITLKPVGDKSKGKVHKAGEGDKLAMELRACKGTLHGAFELELDHDNVLTIKRAGAKEKGGPGTVLVRE